MLTATEVQHVKDVIADLMANAEVGAYNEEEAHQAIELLSRLKPVSTDEVLSSLETPDFIDEDNLEDQE